MNKFHNAINSILVFVGKFRFPTNREIPFPIGQLQLSCPIIKVRPHEEFSKFSIRRKIRSLFFGISLTPDEVSRAACLHAKSELFGDDQDLGSMLFCLSLSIFKRMNDFSSLTDSDKKKATALSGQCHIAQMQYQNKTLSPPLNLFLDQSLGPISTMIVPMSSMILITSARYFLEINPYYTFARLRISGHPNTNSIIDYVYELMLLQQKMALVILEVHALAFTIQQKKQSDPSALFLKEEGDTIAKFDLLVTYFKASIEKTIVLLGEAHEISSIESRKKHSQRVKALEMGLPKVAREQLYCQYLLDAIKSENLEELNNLRTGILHKKGAANLQPHMYTGKQELVDTPIPELMNFAIIHHRNIAMIVAGAFALVVDEIMRRRHKAKDVRKTDIAELNEVMKNMGVAYDLFWPKG